MFGRLARDWPSGKRQRLSAASGCRAWPMVCSRTKQGSTMATTTTATPRLTRSYAYCERLTRREAGNFYPAFRLLPRRQCRAMCALYSFLRIADDFADGNHSLAEKQSALAAWQAALDDALEGR